MFLFLEAMAGPPDFILEQQQAMSMSPTSGRLEFIRRVIADIKTSLATLRAHVEGEVCASVTLLEITILLYLAYVDLRISIILKCMV